jgi:hypothetical protein
LVTEILIVSNSTDNGNSIHRGLRFTRAHLAAVAACSALLIVPCFWHRRIEAGDLPSHTYNAWLAQLIEQGRAPGLYTVHQWTNVLFDFLLLYSTKLFGFAVGPKIAVAVCVLVFFWGVFSFVTVASDSAPWLLSPLLAMLAYGYAFNMGFFNYYLSIGLACFALALFWPVGHWTWNGVQRSDLLVGGGLLLLAVQAHPIGPLWCLATLAYVAIRRGLLSPWRRLLPAAAVFLFIGGHLYFSYITALEVSWPGKPFYFFNGADQLVTYRMQYRYVAAAVALTLGALLVWRFYRRRERAISEGLPLLAELYILAFCAIALLPQDIRMGLYGAWIGLLVSRLTLISAILAFTAASCLKPSKIVFASIIVCAALFFALLYRDTQTLNRLELHAEQLAASLPYGTRFIPTLEARPDSRIPFVGHVLDRACIGHCFTFSNYEPSSRQFRVRAAAGNDFATASASDSQEMESGNYAVQSGDPPLVDIYQCSPTDSTILCARKLAVGEKTGQATQEPED